MEHQVGDVVEIGRVSVQNDEACAALLGEDGKTRSRVDDEGRPDGDEEVGRDGRLFRGAHRRFGHRLPERNGGGFDEPAALGASGRFFRSLEFDANLGELVAAPAVEAGRVHRASMELDDALRGHPACLV